MNADTAAQVNAHHALKLQGHHSQGACCCERAAEEADESAGAGAYPGVSAEGARCGVGAAHCGGAPHLAREARRALQQMKAAREMAENKAERLREAQWAKEQEAPLASSIAALRC